jgi:hypothetical protein
MASRNNDTSLPRRLQPARRALEKDLLERTRIAGVEAGLRAAWVAEKQAGETGQGFDPWRRARVTQIAVAWVLSVVFVRTLEDRGLIDPRIAGPDAHRLATARDREATFVQIAPFLGPREYLLTVFRELASVPGASEVFDARHNPVWVLAPSSDGARALLDFFQRVDAATGAPAITFGGKDTRFLGDLYQDLSEAVRKRYALLQTPDFVEKFILEQTLAPAIREFGLAEVRLIDPTCGSGHFLLGAFRDLLAAWQQQEPTSPMEELARRALDQVYGVDINPYAVAIARFRLVLAVLDAVGITRLAKAPALRPHVVVADSLLHRIAPQEQLRLSVAASDSTEWGDALFRLAEPGAVSEVLGQRYHAVVGNPPYITEKDGVKRRRFIQMYDSASANYALAAPFTERFFELGVEGGFIGLINSNAWTKRDFGRPLIQKVLPRLDVQKVIDTAGCYIAGHGTPTLLLFGRNRSPADAPVVAVLGKRGESKVPDDPATAPVWSEIVSSNGQVGHEGNYVSVETFDRKTIGRHPWILVGGGARTMLASLVSSAPRVLVNAIEDLGFSVIIGEDDAFVRPLHAVRALPSTPFVTGHDVRDWEAAAGTHVLRPFRWSDLEVEEDPGLTRELWPWRRRLEERIVSGSTSMIAARRKWFDLRRLSRSKHKTPLAIAFASVATHNNFVFDRMHKVFNRHAPIIKLHPSRSEADHQSVLGYLNSSTVGFWCRLVMYPKGGATMGDGAIVTPYPWMDRLEYAGNLLQQLPVPDLNVLRADLLDLVVGAEETVQAMTELGADKVVVATLKEAPSLAALRDARTHSLAERSRLRGILISLQEEMDWRVYGMFGLPTVTAPSVDAVRLSVEPNHRPFEVRLAREIDSDISASEWFRVHKRVAPADVGGPLADLYRQRLRLLDDPEHGRQLRLLETPETKRRWSPPDDSKAFREAVRNWLLERMEAVFRDQPTPELRTARQLALDLGRDAAVQAAWELLTEDSGSELVKLVSELVDAEGVPFLAGLRFAETGMEKHAAWEETWRLQRLEDDGKLAPELKRLGLTAIPVPDKYANKDFLRHYWGLRGKLDVPKERFITVPLGNTEDDPTPLCGWAGWNHLQTSQALAALYQRRKTEDGWPTARLLPLLAGLAERVPWLLQWHNAPDAAYGGVKLGDFFRDFVAGEAHTLGVAVDFTKATDDLRTWTPPAAPRKQTLDPDELYAALLRWTPELDDDIDEDAADGSDDDPPEGPTMEELSTDAGAPKALVSKALKALLADGRVEKLDGRPARYVVVGGEV